MTTTNRRISLLVAAAALALSASPVLAQKITAKTTAPKHETQVQLQALAKVPMTTARATALATVPKGTIKSEELEREHGKLLYSFDIATAGKSGIDEVQVDASTGSLIGGVVHENAAAEAAEAKAEAKEAKAGTKAAKTVKPKP